LTLIGEQIGPYEVSAKLGEGLMGMVYRAHDTRLRRNVTLKFISIHGQTARLLHPPNRRPDRRRDLQRRLKGHG
jgi:serine/threonine protein kinase